MQRVPVLTRTVATPRAASWPIVRALRGSPPPHPGLAPAPAAILPAWLSEHHLRPAWATWSRYSGVAPFASCYRGSCTWAAGKHLGFLPLPLYSSLRALGLNEPASPLASPPPTVDSYSLRFAQRPGIHCHATPGACEPRAQFLLSQSSRRRNISSSTHFHPLKCHLPPTHSPVSP